MTNLKVFSAPWCGPCKSMEPHLQELANRGHLITKIDIDAQPTIAAMHGVRGVPTLKLYKDDQLLRSHTGAMSLGQLETFVTP